MLEASVNIVTRNREQDLMRVLKELRRYVEVARLSVTILDDASDTVGLTYFQRIQESGASLRREQTRGGLIKQRNRLHRETDAEIQFSLDDDSCFIDEEGPSAAIEYLQQNSKVAALSFPVVCREPFGSLSKAKPQPCRAFVGCGYAVRKKEFIEVGGYREDFVHQGEETELCLRLWKEGFAVHAFPSCRVHHWATSNARDWSRMHYFGPRNRVWTSFLHTPFPHLPLEILKTILSYAKLSLRTRAPQTHLLGLLAGFGNGLASWGKQRASLRPREYQRWKQLPPDASGL